MAAEVHVQHTIYVHASAALAWGPPQCHASIAQLARKSPTGPQEFYALLSFVVPDALGSMALFNAVYAAPITRAQDRDASDSDRELGVTRARYDQPAAAASKPAALQEMMTQLQMPGS